MLFVLIFLFFYQPKSNAQNKTYPFKLGEKLEYTMQYGWFKIGEAIITIDPTLQGNNKDQFLVQCKLKTTGLAKLLADLQACTETYVDVSSLLPELAIWEINNDKRNETKGEFYTYSDSVIVLEKREFPYKKRTRSFSKKKGQVRDPLSTYLWLRSQVPSTINNIETQVFFSGKVYPFGMVALEPADYKRDSGKEEVLRYELVFPVSTAFPKGKKGKVIVSNDAQKIPLKFEIEMNLGTFHFTLVED